MKRAMMYKWLPAKTKMETCVRISKESQRNVVKISERTVFFLPMVNNSKQSREYFRASILTHKPFLIRQIFVGKKYLEKKNEAQEENKT